MWQAVIFGTSTASTIKRSVVSHAPPRRWNSEKLLQTFKEKTMKNLMLQLHKNEAGQGLVEYALIIALVAFAAIVGMNTLATDINLAFSNIGSVLNAKIT
jgi:pilus assembly protein Flp/PilA